PAGQAAAATKGEGSQPWLVSPRAVILINGNWTVTWVISNPPPVAQWTAVVWFVPPSHFAGSCHHHACPPPKQRGPRFYLRRQGGRSRGVIATAAYHPAPTSLSVERQSSPIWPLWKSGPGRRPGLGLAPGCRRGIFAGWRPALGPQWPPSCQVERGHPLRT